MMRISRLFETGYRIIKTDMGNYRDEAKRLIDLYKDGKITVIEYSERIINLMEEYCLVIE
jgi:hypothetical protein